MAVLSTGLSFPHEVQGSLPSIRCPVLMGPGAWLRCCQGPQGPQTMAVPPPPSVAGGGAAGAMAPSGPASRTRTAPANQRVRRANTTCGLLPRGGRGRQGPERSFAVAQLGEG